MSFMNLEPENRPWPFGPQISAVDRHRDNLAGSKHWFPFRDNSRQASLRKTLVLLSLRHRP
jgi:hypothetical protein